MTPIRTEAAGRNTSRETFTGRGVVVYTRQRRGDSLNAVTKTWRKFPYWRARSYIHHFTVYLAQSGNSTLFTTAVAPDLVSPSHLWKEVSDLAVGILRRIYLRHAFQELRVF